jgi:hypothetical protein
LAINSRTCGSWTFSSVNCPGDAVADAGLALEPGLRIVVEHSLRNEIVDAAGDLLDVAGLEVEFLGEIDCAFDRTMQREAAGIKLHGEHRPLQRPLFAERRRLRFDLAVVGAEKREEAHAAFEYLCVGRESSRRERRRDDTIPCRQAAMEGLRHRAEILARAGRHGGAKAERHSHLVERQAHQPAGGNRSAERADRRGGMPAALVMLGQDRPADRRLDFEAD